MKKAILAVLLAIGLFVPVEAQQSCFGASCPASLQNPTFGGTVTFSAGATLVLPLTTFASQGGIVYKGADRFLSDFNYGDNGTVTTVGWNTFLGVQSGNLTAGSTATSTTEASKNTAIGYQSGNALTTGYSNTLLGAKAGVLITSGTTNTAVGALSLATATTATRNVAIGFQALTWGTGGGNTVVGANALYAFPNSGTNNSAFGAGSLASISSGSSNVAIGNGTGFGITTGSENTLLGANTNTLPADLTRNVMISTGNGIIRARAVPEFSLTDNTATTFAVLTLGNDTGGGGSFDYCVYAQDATTGGIECWRIDFAGIDVTAGAGGEVCPNPTKVGTPLQALSGSTLSVTFTATTGTDLCNLRVTADTDIVTPVALNIKWWAVNSGRTLTPS